MKHSTHQVLKVAKKESLPPWIDEMRIHDAIIKSCTKVGSNIVMKFEHTCAYTEISQVIFENAEITKQQVVSLEDYVWWLDNKVYKKKDRYEIRIAIWGGKCHSEEYKNSNRISQLVVTAENVTFIR